MITLTLEMNVAKNGAFVWHEMNSNGDYQETQRIELSKGELALAENYFGAAVNHILLLRDGRDDLDGKCLACGCKS